MEFLDFNCLKLSKLKLKLPRLQINQFQLLCLAAKHDVPNRAFLLLFMTRNGVHRYQRFEAEKVEIQTSSGSNSSISTVLFGRRNDVLNSAFLFLYMSRNGVPRFQLLEVEQVEVEASSASNSSISTAFFGRINDLLNRICFTPVYVQKWSSSISIA